MYNILIATDLTEESTALLEGADDVQVTSVPPTVNTMRKAIGNANALIVRDDVPVDADLLDAAPHLRLIARPTAGLSGVDVDAATARGIIVMNTPGISAIAAGEHTFTLMLALSRRLVQSHNGMKEGFWLMDRRRLAGTQLYGKTLGVVGLGRVGRLVAARALAFGMTVLACDPYLSEEQLGDERVLLVGLRELLQRSDFVTLHVPATAETTRMIDTERIAQMKPGARLINTGHGGAVDESALVAALKSGQLAGAAVDVYAEEPPYHSALIGMENVIHTPHIGDNTVEAAQDLSIQIVQQVMDALRGDDYRNAVNMPFMPGADFETVRPYLALGERMGMLLHTLARSAITRVAVELRGDDMQGMIKPVTVAMLKGLLEPVLGETVSYINAPLLAAERAIQVTQSKNLPTGDSYANLLSAQVTLADGEDIVMAGTLLDRKTPHIVEINQYRMNFVPEGHLLIMGSYDRPGVIGRVGTLMAENAVNIASWHTGRAEPGGQTLTVLTLDAPLPESLLDTLLELDFVRHAHQVGLDS